MDICYSRISSEEIQVACIRCQEVHTIPITETQIDAFERGAHIQLVVPKVHRALREMLVSGICGKCWDEIHGVEPDCDDEEHEDESET